MRDRQGKRERQNGGGKKESTVFETRLPPKEFAAPKSTVLSHPSGPGVRRNELKRVTVWRCLIRAITMSHKKQASALKSTIRSRCLYGIGVSTFTLTQRVAQHSCSFSRLKFAFPLVKRRETKSRVPVLVWNKVESILHQAFATPKNLQPSLQFWRVFGTVGGESKKMQASTFG